MKRTKRQTTGQHFLASGGIISKIVDCIDPGKEDWILEIGAGRGALTFPLTERAGRVIAIEKDAAFLPVLREMRLDNLDIRIQDVLDVRFADLIPPPSPSRPTVKLAGNLPYSISSPILFKLLEEKRLFERVVFLVQKEVAERICAGPDSKSYAPVSILIKNHFSAKLCFSVHPGSFIPPPKVTSALVMLKTRERPLFDLREQERFLRFLRIVFLQRRKTFANNLKSMGTPVAEIKKVLIESGFDERVRAEQISPEKLHDLYLKLMPSG